MMMTRRCELVFAAVLLAAPAVWANPDPADVAYEEGRRLYDLREWDLAIAKFKESYRIKPAAKSLFNIAQAFRLKGDCVEAINFYRTYKRNFPKEQNVGKVDKFIVELEPCAKKQGDTTPPVTPPVQQKPPAVQQKPPAVQPQPWLQPKPQPNVQQPPPPVVQQPTLQPSPITPPEHREVVPGRTQRRVAVGVFAVGAVMVGTGIYFGLEAQARADDITTGSGPFDPSIEAAGKSADTKAKVLSGIGIAAIAAGIVVFTIAPSKKQQQLGIAPSKDGAFVVWSGKL